MIISSFGSAFSKMCRWLSGKHSSVNYIGVLLFISPVDNILIISNRVTKVLNMNDGEIYASA